VLRIGLNNEGVNMKSRKIAVLIAMSMLTGVPVVCAAGADDAQVQEAVEAHNAGVDDVSQQLVCKKEAVTGSRLKKTVCRTQATIDAEQDAAKHYVNKPRQVPTKE
jgi:hypothetical protein